MTMGLDTRYVTNFVDELSLNGLTDVVISPGSRSTPLALTFAEHPKIKPWIHFDERSSAFFALGIAKSSHKPVALVCTSGTAVANYYPAIVEAYYSRIPLIVLTADRPHELRDNGAPQAIDQIKMFGDYVKYFHEMAIPHESEQMIRYARRQAARAYQLSMANQAAPVQLNFPFKDPLIPDFTLDDLWGNQAEAEPHLNSVVGQETVSPEAVVALLKELHSYQKGVIVCGELPADMDVAAIHELAQKFQLPLFTDVLSHARFGSSTNDMTIATYDAILKDPAVAKSLEADFVIRFGAMPVSKSYYKWIEQLDLKKHIIVDEASGYREPTGIQTTIVYSNPSTFVHQLLNATHTFKGSEKWLNDWLKMDELARRKIEETVNGEELTEGKVAYELSKAVKDEEIIFVGSSMPIRDLDTFALRSKKNYRVFSNRGVNGIDGVISTAFGFAAAGKQVTLLVGDLTFLHDYTALFIGRKHALNLRIVVANNNGGGIFSFLPQNEHQTHFETLFGTPFDPPIKPMVKAVGFKYDLPKTGAELKMLLSRPVTGVEVIEVQTDRDENKRMHRALWDAISKEIKEHVIT